MRALKEPSGGAVCRDSLVVLTLSSEGVREADPSGSKVWVHHAGLGKESASLSNAAGAQIVYGYGKPGGGFVRVQIGKTVGKKEESVCFVEFVEASKMERIDSEVVFVVGKDSGGEGESVFEAALSEEKVGFSEEKIRILQ